MCVPMLGTRKDPFLFQGAWMIGSGLPALKAPCLPSFEQTAALTAKDLMDQST